MGYAKLSARPRHYAQDRDALEASKKLPRTLEGDPRRARQRCRGRSLVAGLGPRRAEEQDHPAMGETRHVTVRAQGPENGLGLYLRRHLPDERKGGPARHAPGRHTGVERPSRRNRQHRRTRNPCPRHARPSGITWETRAVPSILPPGGFGPGHLWLRSALQPN